MPRTETVPQAHQLRQTMISTPTRGTVQLLMGRGCFMITGYLVSVILARTLGPKEFGVYGVIMSVLTWIEMAASAGIPGATAKLMPQHESQAPAVERAARILLLTTSLLLFFLCWVFAPAFARLFDIPMGTALFRIAILDLPFTGMYLAYQGVLHGYRRFGVLSLGLIVYGLTKLFGILILFVLGLSVSGALVVNVLATIGVLVYLVVAIPPMGSRPPYALVHAMLRVALPMGLYLIASQVLLHLDLWSLMSLWTGPEEVIGFYVAALNVTKVLVVVPSVLSGVLFASLSWALAQKSEGVAQRYIQEAGRLAFIILSPLCLLLATHAEAVTTLLYSDVYAPGGQYLVFLLVAFGLLAFFDLFFHALMAADKRYLCVGILLTLIPIALLCNVALIPRWGAVGAALSLVLTVGLGTAVAAIFAHRRFGPLMRVSTVARVTAATGLMSLVSAQVSIAGPWLLLKFTALLGIYVFFLSLLAELGKKDWDALALWERSSP